MKNINLLIEKQINFRSREITIKMFLEHTIITSILNLKINIFDKLDRIL